MDDYVFKNKKDCCGCGACINICPKNAISMCEDEYGFTYPKIKKEKCINCGLCKKVCTFRAKRDNNENINNYVAFSENDEIVLKSASGGIFAEIAKDIILNGGIVYGCSMEMVDNKLHAQHIRVDSMEQLNKLQGSKYVQSDCSSVYKFVREDLKNNRLVLFSGTPCQVNSLKSFLQGKNYDNLYLIDIICHGVPSIKMFQDYIAEYEKKNECKVKEFAFRDKTYGWGLFFKIIYEKKSKIIEKTIPCFESSFYQLFLDSAIYRENCYECPFANSNRVGDLTIGDYWGIKEEHPELTIDVKRGVSCVIVNNKHGEYLVDKFGNEIKKYKSEFEKISKHNHQLKSPSCLKKERDKILNLYKESGFKEVDRYYKRTRFIKNNIKRIRNLKNK